VLYDVTMMLHGCYKDVRTQVALFQVSENSVHEGITRMLQGCCDDVTRMLQGCYKDGGLPERWSPAAATAPTISQSRENDHQCYLCVMLGGECFPLFAVNRNPKNLHT
jgi:hypothetical protein